MLPPPHYACFIFSPPLWPQCLFHVLATAAMWLLLVLDADDYVVCLYHVLAAVAVAVYMLYTLAATAVYLLLVLVLAVVESMSTLQGV